MGQAMRRVKVVYLTPKDEPVLLLSGVCSVLRQSLLLSVIAVDDFHTAAPGGFAPFLRSAADITCVVYRRSAMMGVADNGYLDSNTMNTGLHLHDPSLTY